MDILYAVSGVLSTVLFAYLVLALFKPEWFK